MFLAGVTSTGLSEIHRRGLTAGALAYLISSLSCETSLIITLHGLIQSHLVPVV
jgi:hypothetical protein